MRILVVEDEKRIADFLSRGLEGAGYAVDLAPSGGHALDCIHSADYDLVILDLMLPDMDGLQVLEKIRNRKLGPPELLGDLEGDRLRALARERVKVPADEAPREERAQLELEAAAGVIAATDREH